MSSEKFVSGSDSEKKMRVFICMLGMSLFLCAVAAFLDFFISIEKTPEFLLESAFIVSDADSAPKSYINEKQE